MADNGNIANSAPGEAARPVESSTVESRPQNRALSCLLLPSFSEACKLVSGAYSCLVLRTHRRPLALSPRYLNKKRSGIQEHLNAELLKYSSRLEGVPVAYDNVKIVGEFGDIQDDVGYIHLNIQADFVIFQPQSGEKLVGVVNKVAPSHIGCLVHGCFNASIPRPFKMPVEAWQHVGVNVGDHIEFEVFRLDSDAVGVFCIRGRIDKKMENDAIEKLNEATKEPTKDNSSDTENAAEDWADPEQKMIPEETPKKKAKKSAFKETLLQDVPGNPEVSGEINATLEEIPKKKCKKRKYQEINSQTDFAQVDTSIENIPAVSSALESLDQSVDNISHKARKKKKRHDSLPSVNIDNTIRDEEIHILAFDNESLVSSSREQPKKKKKHKDNCDRGLNESFQNGIAEGPSFIEDTALEDMKAEAENLKKKHKKKHKQSSSIDDSTLESPNGGEDFTSQQSLLDDLTVHQEIPKQKKHKKEHKLSSSIEDSTLESPNGQDFTSQQSLLDDLTIHQEVPKQKKHKKKHKLSSSIEDSTLESPNGQDFTSQQSLLDDLTIHQEIPKQKKHKRKHLANVLADSDYGASLAEDRNVLHADSQQFAEPKAKTKRKK
ncbi:PREDICTED: DNA-directed RNA polymerase I subunit RPA43 [Nanorana parkeri]|uniref:DNA-directed RNA polymerase I subunit RPA43 n=1 Tax=Nanorana parkeri TaxID=125878 RepID=UPI000854C082|nr:PREDICTED: DNA-directed RNA polymerase I subunit RPA43 [Nanorana parkeri]